MCRQISKPLRIQNCIAVTVIYKPLKVPQRQTTKIRKQEAIATPHPLSGHISATSQSIDLNHHQRTKLGG